MFTLENVYFAAFLVAVFIVGLSVGLLLGWRAAIWRLMTENADQFATIGDGDAEGSQG